MPIMRVGDPTYDERKAGNRVFIRFRVNRQPDESWIETFKGHEPRPSQLGEAPREAPNQCAAPYGLDFRSLQRPGGTSVSHG